MTCHKCRHNREIARLAEEQSRLREICSKCRLGEDLAGDNSISTDSITDGFLDHYNQTAPNHELISTFDPNQIDEPQPESDEATKTRDALTTLLACAAVLPFDLIVPLAKAFNKLKREDFEIVAHLLNGGTMIGYAEAYGLSKQTAFARIKTLFTDHPIFRAIANGGLTHGAGGRVPIVRPNYQMDFFDLLEGS